METNFNWLYAKVRKLKKENAKLKKALQKTELDKLQKYLDKANIKYERIDKDCGFGMSRHQIIFKNENGITEWDAICQPGSYGYSDGLIEVAGVLCQNEYDGVEGWLTADDIAERLGIEI